jgi:hypothetical protein
VSGVIYPSILLSSTFRFQGARNFQRPTSSGGSQIHSNSDFWIPSVINSESIMMAVSSQFSGWDSHDISKVSVESSDLSMSIFLFRWTLDFVVTGSVSCF